MDKKQVIRLAENDIRRIVRESVENVISEVSAMPKGFKHRFDPDKRDGDFPLEQPEWTKDPRWQGWNGEDPEWIMKKEKESGDPYYGNKKQARVSESQLHQIVKESVEKVLDEGLFDKFRRTAQAKDAYKGLDGDYSYSKDKDRFYYHDKYGNKHDTGIGYGKGNVGTNWNPLKWWNSGDRQVTQNDAKRAKSRLQNFDNGKGNPFTDRGMIDNTARRNYDKEQEHRKEEASRRRREEEQQYYERNKGQYSRPQQQGNGFSTADLIYGVDRKH